MKTKVVLIILATLFTGAGHLFAAEPDKTEKFKVYGNCGMCESRIEKAAGAVKGVTSADWDKKTKDITIRYDAAVTSPQKVHAAIARAGHDTGEVRADDKTYSKLHNCCKYERPEVKPA